jgi:hypothetical protein
MDSLHPFSLEISASDLPESLIARFPERPMENDRLVITIEPAETDEDKIFQLQADIEQGITDIEAGRFSSFSDVIADLEKRFPPV